MKRLPIVRACVGLLMGIALAVEAKPAGPDTIPFTLRGGDIVLQAALGTAKPLPFIFDSGLSHGNIVTVDTAAALDLKPTGDVHFGDASGAGHHTGLTQVAKVEIGDATLTDQPFAIVNVPSRITERPGKTPIAGFVGAPLMANAVLCIDYRHQVMHRWSRAAFGAGKRESIPMPQNHGLPTIQVKVNGIEATLAIDSGNNGGVELFPSFSEPHHLREQLPDLKPLEGMAGSGEQFDILSGTARTVAVGAQALRDVDLMLITQSFDPAWGIDGLAGYKFLSRLDPCLDRDGEKLYFTVR